MSQELAPVSAETFSLEKWAQPGNVYGNKRAFNAGRSCAAKRAHSFLHKHFRRAGITLGRDDKVRDYPETPGNQVKRATQRSSACLQGFARKTTDFHRQPETRDNIGDVPAEALAPHLRFVCQNPPKPLASQWPRLPLARQACSLRSS